MIEVRDLSKVYAGRHGHPDHVAVSGVEFSVKRQGALGVVGESGAGKTTLASMLMGFEPPTSGWISIEGERRPSKLRRRERKDWARRIQIVFQDPYSSLDPHQTIGDCLSEVLKFHFPMTARARSARVSELLESVGLSGGRTNLTPRSLSGGQRQRLAIARALAVQPRVLILDESVSALDVSVQAQVLNLLADLRQELGLTYIFISHDLGVIRYATEQVIVMCQGEVVEAGATKKVLDKPTDPYTKMLRDAVPRPGWQPRRSTQASQPLSG